MTEKRFTTVELPKPNKWGIWYDGAYLSTYQVCILLNEYVDVKKENEQLKRQVKEYTMRNTVNSDLYDETYEQLEKMEKNYKSLLNENEQLKADKQSLIDFIRKEFPKSYKHILEGFE